MVNIARMPIAEMTPDLIAPGTSARFRLEVDDGLAAPADVPALVARGGEPGPTLVAVAGVHGDEYEGMEAIRQVFAHLDPARLRGCFLGIPVANPFAYEARARTAPAHIDGLNLARIFPGNSTGTPSQRLANALLGLVERMVGPADLFLDFHSGSADVAFAPLVGFRDISRPATVIAADAAQHFGCARVWRIPDAAGPFNAETSRRGIPTVATETTGRAGCAADDVATFVAGLKNLLAYMKMLLDVPPLPAVATSARTTVDLRAPTTGFLRCRYWLGDEVEAGERLGTIVTPFGDVVAELAAPATGSLWALRTMPAVRAGELVAMIAVRD